MAKIFEIEPVFCDEIPEVLQEGILYITIKHSFANHLCACGCGKKSPTALTPVWKGEWTLTNNQGKVTLRPSLGNWKGQNPYHAHYYITDNKIEWL